MTDIYEHGCCAICRSIFGQDQSMHNQGNGVNRSGWNTSPGGIWMSGSNSEPSRFGDYGWSTGFGSDSGNGGNGGYDNGGSSGSDGCSSGNSGGGGSCGGSGDSGGGSCGGSGDSGGGSCGGSGDSGGGS